MKTPYVLTATVIALVGCSTDAVPGMARSDAATDQGPPSMDAMIPDAGMDAGMDTTVDATADDVLMPPAIPRTQSEAVLAAQRQGCAFMRGAWPAQTIGAELPVGDSIPIRHVLVIMQENRSFDHYLGRLVAQGYYRPGDFGVGADGGVGEGFAHSDELDGPPTGWSNPDADGTPVHPHPDTERCYGLNHGWNDMHDDWDNGRNDHFVTNNNPDGQRSMFYEDDTVIPFYYALANTFAVGDQYHASVMSSTWPNRYFLMAATSFGIGDNSFATQDTAQHPADNIFYKLEAGHHTWKDYTDGPHMEAFFPYFGLQRGETAMHYGSVRCDLMRDITHNTLPDVGFIMGDEVTESGDEGPSDLPEIGGQWVEGVIRALWASPAWQDTAVFITYDENGGTADHVPPAAACPPDNLAPHLGDGTALPGAFNYTGFRVPFIVVSPYARAHYVSHTVYDHTSITRFIEARFGLPALTARDANATPPYDLFDFASPAFMTPPSIAAHTTVDPGVLARCGEAVVPLTCGDDGGS